MKTRWRCPPDICVERPIQQTVQAKKSGDIERDALVGAGFKPERPPASGAAEAKDVGHQLARLVPRRLRQIRHDAGEIAQPPLPEIFAAPENLSGRPAGDRAGL